MSLLTRIFGKARDEFATVRPLWHRTVAVARDPAWFRAGGVADSVAGRFDTVTLVLAAVLLRMEREPALIEPSVRVTELFVSDMDGQLRQGGVGDLVVGKHMGKLMSVLGGRLGALRPALESRDVAAVEAVVARNVTLREGADAAASARLLLGLAETLDAIGAEELLAATFVLPA